MFNARPPALWPWLYLQPPVDDATPGFRLVADSPGWPLLDNHTIPTIPGHGPDDDVAASQDAPARATPSAVAGPSELPHPWFNLDANDPDGTLARPPGFRLDNPADTPPGFRMAEGEPARQAASGMFGRTFPDDGNTAFDLLDLAPPWRDPLQEALKQPAKIYAGFGGHSHTDPPNANPNDIMLGGDWVRRAGPPAAGDDAFDPRYVVPAQARGGFVRPPPGPGDNHPPAAKGPLNPGQAVQAPFPHRPPAAQPPPDTAGAAALAEASERKRAATLQTYREQLQTLDPGNSLLKLEPVAGVVPDQATVDSHGEEVKGVVRKKFDQAVDALSAQSNYIQRSRVRTIGGDADLRAEFDRLKVTGKRIYGGGSGQYSSGGDGELYELPGGMLVGYRMANDTQGGEKRMVPTLDIVHPGRGRFKFHYNNPR